MEASDETPFQSLLFIVRDWYIPYEKPYGHSQRLVDEKFGENPKRSPEMRDSRAQIQSCFDKIGAFLMPHPGKAVAEAQHFDGNLQQIDATFINCVKDLVPSLLAPENLIIKKINGEKMRVRDFLPCVEKYVDIFNGKILPEPKSILMVSHEKCRKID